MSVICRSFVGPREKNLRVRWQTGRSGHDGSDILARAGDKRFRWANSVLVLAGGCLAAALVMVVLSQGSSGNYMYSTWDRAWTDVTLPVGGVVGMAGVMAALGTGLSLVGLCMGPKPGYKGFVLFIGNVGVLLAVGYVLARG